jgi:hypothetical protein
LAQVACWGCLQIENHLQNTEVGRHQGPMRFAVCQGALCLLAHHLRHLLGTRCLAQHLLWLVGAVRQLMHVGRHAAAALLLLLLLVVVVVLR